MNCHSWKRFDIITNEIKQYITMENMQILSYLNVHIWGTTSMPNTHMKFDCEV